MSKLNDTQSVLLATAAQSDSGSLYPVPETFTFGAELAHAISNLTALMFVHERDTPDYAATHRTDRSFRVGLFITPAGLHAIGIEPEGGGQPTNSGKAPSPSAPAADLSRIRANQVLALVSRPDGAILAELSEAIGWLPNATRAALTGLRKKGRTIGRSKRADQTCYRIQTADAA